MTTGVVATIRKNIASAGGSELKALELHDSLREIWRMRQETIQAMNVARKLASDQASEPFLAKLAELDRQYAFMLQMVGDNGERS